MDPYNNNPFTTDSHEIRNERDANRALANTVRRLVPKSDEWEMLDPFNEWGTWEEELRPEELERIEVMAELEELRHNGYGE